MKLKNLFLNEKIVLGVILLNAIVIFIEGFEKQEFSSVLDLFDNIFTLYFLAEIAFKFREWGVKKYFKSSWNIFDFSLVVLALPSLFAWIFKMNILELDVLLVFRVMRVFKFFRFIRFVPKIDHIISGVYKASKASLVIIIAFFIFNFIISLLSCFFFKNISPEYFADPIVSFYSIFKIFTVEGWYEIADSIESTSNVTIFLSRIYFIIILLFGGVFGLSLVNSIFVDSMVSDNNKELEDKVISLENKITELIDKLDKKQS